MEVISNCKAGDGLVNSFWVMCGCQARSFFYRAAILIHLARQSPRFPSGRLLIQVKTTMTRINTISVPSIAAVLLSLSLMGGNDSAFAQSPDGANCSTCTTCETGTCFTEDQGFFKRLGHSFGRKSQKFRRSWFKRWQRKKELQHPENPPYYEANWGYQETCWRPFPPLCNPCPPIEAYLTSDSSLTEPVVLPEMTADFFEEEITEPPFIQLSFNQDR